MNWNEAIQRMQTVCKHNKDLTREICQPCSTPDTSAKQVDVEREQLYYAWLIEQRDSNGKPTWLKIDNFIHEQTDNAWEALHFGRKVDAEAYAAGNEDEVIYITEHAFQGPKVAALSTRSDASAAECTCDDESGMTDRGCVKCWGDTSAVELVLDIRQCLMEVLPYTPDMIPRSTINSIITKAEQWLKKQGV
jgi:hypothetical protein